MASIPFRYQSPEEDSARWLGFPFRDGDIVISTRSKTGTTWVQMICALLIFQAPELPAPLAQLSPWLDHLIVPREEVYAQLAAQEHRRFIKTHTPLDGIPLDPRARTRSFPLPGSSRATPRSSAGAPQARDERFSERKNSPPTTPAQPSWHRPTCLPGSTRSAASSPSLDNNRI